jgi:uncharacterized protein (TIGR00299 family) protein
MPQTADTAYLDCFSGISGDMLLGGLLDCGLKLAELQAELAKLPIDPFEITASPCSRQAISATSVNITATSEQRLRHLSDITSILQNSSLEPDITARSLRVFQRIAEAEAKVHNKPIEEVHFHEVGALDTIIDIVGTVCGFQLLGIRNIHCSPLPLGRGFVRCAHGNLPLPGPAVCEILKDVPVYGIEADYELVTPTGAALAAELADQFGPLPPMQIYSTGYGAGQSEGSEQRPNLLRLITGSGQAAEEAQEIVVIETNLDDWSPEGFPFLCERLFQKNALDVSLTPIQMKKGRPGFCLQVICNPKDGLLLKQTILDNSTAIGLRFRLEQRVTLAREMVTIATSWGDIAAKRVMAPSGPRVYPEFEACRKVAEQNNIPLDLVYREIISCSEDKG